MNEPFVRGKHDNQIFRKGLCQLLFDDEACWAVEADQGYGGDNKKLKTPDMGDHRLGDRKMKANAHAQHEAVNGRLKQFNVFITHF